MRKNLRILILSMAVTTLIIALSVPPVTAIETGLREKETIVLKAYGPGGPAPAMREAAKVFGSKKGCVVEIIAGPAGSWKDQAVKDADLIFSGSEYMMIDFVRKTLAGFIDTSTIRTLYLRPSALVVRPGNPKQIKGIKDLLKPGIKILVVEGAGQIGLWEDVAGRTGDARIVEDIRRNIGFFAETSAEAKKIWNSDPSYDVWLTWTIWQKENPSAGELVEIEPEYRVYRSCAIAITNRTAQKKLSEDFVSFLKSQEGKEIFVKYGWIAR